MRTSQRGVDLLKSFEGLSLTAVKLSGEPYFTIGYGHYGPDVLPGQRVSYAEAEAMLRNDLRIHESYVTRYAAEVGRFNPNQNQFDALVSFCYNCGPGCLRQLLMGRTPDEVAAHMLAYTGAIGGEIYREGLTRRRRAERELFLTPMREDELDMTKEELLTLDGTGDVHSSGETAEAAIAWAKANKIFVGDGKGNYGWQQPITREAVAILLYKLLAGDGK